jgi:hypothetical protein
LLLASAFGAGLDAADVFFTAFGFFTALEILAGDFFAGALFEDFFGFDDFVLTAFFAIFPHPPV